MLDEPAGQVLASFRDHDGAVSAWFAVLALSAALLAPVAIGVGRMSAARVTASDVLGTAVGETLGYLLTATWTMLVIAALGRRFAGRWFQILGAVSAALVVVGVLSPLGLAGIDTANFFGYVLWSVWLIAFAIAILLQERRGAAPTPGASRDEVTA